MFLCEYCKILKNTYFEEHLQTADFEFISTSKNFMMAFQSIEEPVKIQRCI